MYINLWEEWSFKRKSHYYKSHFLIEFYIKELLNFLVKVSFYILKPEVVYHFSKLDTFHLIYASHAKVTWSSYFPLIWKEQSFPCIIQWLTMTSHGTKKNLVTVAGWSTIFSSSVVYNLSTIWLVSFILHSCIFFFSCKLPAKLYVHLKGIQSIWQAVR